MKIIGGIVCVLLVLAWGESMMDDSDSAVAQQAAAVEEVSGESSESDRIVELTVEGEALATEVGALANQGVGAANAMDVGLVCELVDEMKPKIERLSKIVDELDAYSSVPQSTIIELRGNETQIRSVLPAADELC